MSAEGAPADLAQPAPRNRTYGTAESSHRDRMRRARSSSEGAGIIVSSHLVLENLFAVGQMHAFDQRRPVQLECHVAVRHELLRLAHDIRVWSVERQTGRTFIRGRHPLPHHALDGLLGRRILHFILSYLGNATVAEAASEQAPSRVLVV